MALEAKVLMVSISPSRTDARSDTSAVDKRVDTFIETLKKVAKQGVRPRLPISANLPVIALC